MVPFGTGVLVVLNPVLVTHHLAIEFVDQFIDGSIQILAGTFREQIVAFHMDIALRALSPLFFLLVLDGQQHANVYHLVKVPHDAVEFLGDIATQCRRDFEVMTTDR